MPKANIKLIFLTFLTLTYLWATGCTGPEEKKSQLIEEATSLRAQGKTVAALAILEGLTESYPNDAAILQSIGQIYSEQGDPTMAAFFLEQAYKQSPDDIELLYQTYLAFKAAKQPTGLLLENLAERDPNAMPPEMWIELGQHLKAQNKTQAALDAYLKGVNPDQATPPANTAAAIGQLFIALENMPQAERWLTIAAESDSPDALTALFGLLEIKLRNKDWEGAENSLTRLDKQFPGAVDASEFASARTELADWRKAQAALQAELKQTAQTTEKTASPESVNETTTSETSGKAAIIEDLNAAEAMANLPAIEVETEEKTAIEDTGLLATTPAAKSTEGTFSPEITIQPADPEAALSVSYNEEHIAGPAAFSASSSSSPVSSKSSTQPSPSPKVLSLDELLEQATQAENDRNYSGAISSYWQALGRANQRADIWNLLARAYLIDGQLKNAETTALEAIRLAPEDVNFTLDYLRVAQRSKKPADFLSELETAYDRFPRSAEITLSLARAYERISRNSITARNLYSRFIEIAPAHPLRSEAESALERLR